MLSVSRVSLMALLCSIHQVTFSVENFHTSDGGVGLERMWKGNATTFRRHPYFARITGLGASQEFFDYCGGSFITPQIILTAAHCIDEYQHGLRARYGMIGVAKTEGQSQDFGRGIDVEISALYIHPNYSSQGVGYEIDFGLVRLKEPIEHTEFLLKLPEPHEFDLHLIGNRSVTFIAMGQSVYDDPGDILKESQIDQVYECNLNGTCCTPGYYLCFRNQSARACLGDSGSPLFVSTLRAKIVVGVVSSGECCKEGSPEETCESRFSRVWVVMPWILETIMKNTRCHCLDELHMKWQLNETLASPPLPP